MPIGIFINGLSILLGGLLGASLRSLITRDFIRKMNIVFGLCSIAMGISSIVNMKYMPAVVFSMVIGTALGIMLDVEGKLHFFAEFLQRCAGDLHKSSVAIQVQDTSADLIVILVLFCASATGIYGSLDASLSGEQTILLSKSILDFFTALLFAVNIGVAVSFVAAPQCIIFLILFYSANLMMPYISSDMILDFKSCGGILMIATGLKIADIIEFSIAEMLPSMLLVMPVSWIWAAFILPLL